MSERLGFGLLGLYLLGFFLAPSRALDQNVPHDAVFYLGLLPWALLAGLRPGLRAIRANDLLKLAVALAGYLGASALWSRGDLELRPEDAALHTLSCLGFLLAAAGLLDEARAQRLLAAMAWTGAGAAALALLAFAAGRSYVGNGRLHSALNFEHPNLFAHALGFALLLALDRLLRRERAPVALVQLAVLAPALLLTRGRLALFACLAGAAVLLAARRGRTAWLGLGVLTLAVAAPALAGTDLADELIRRGDAGRLGIYSRLLERVSAQPLVGLGLRARDDVSFPPGTGDFPGGIALEHAHSAFVATLFFGGLLGLGLLLALAGLGLRRGLGLAGAGAPLPLALLGFGLGCLLLDGHRLVGRPHLTSYLLLWLPLVLVARWPVPAARGVSPAAVPPPGLPARARAAILTAAALMLLGARLPHLRGPLGEPHAWRQLDALHVARTYAASGIDLLRPEVAWMGRNGSAVLDFPLPQAVWSELFRAAGERLALARAVQLAAFAAAVLLLAALARALGLRSAAPWAALVAAAAPLGLVHSQTLLPEQPALAAGLGGALLGLRFLQAGGAARAGGCLLLTSLGLLLAPHWSLAWPIFLAGCAWRAPRPRAAVLAGLLVLALAIGLGYELHAARIDASAPGWPFLAGQRTLPGPWALHLGWPGRLAELRRLAPGLLGDLVGLPLLLPAAAGLLLARGRRLLVGLLLAQVATFVLHLKAAVGRDYDLLPLLVSVALLCGLGLDGIARQGRAGRALAAAVLALAFAGNLRRAERSLAVDPGPFPQVADLVRRATPGAAVVALSWDGVDPRCPLLLVRAERRGFMVPAGSLSAAALSGLRGLGVTHVGVVAARDLSPGEAAALDGLHVASHPVAGLVVHLAALQDAR